MKGSTPTLVASLLLAVVTLAVTCEGAGVIDKPRCLKQGKYLVGNPQDCRSYFYCYEGESFYGLCATGHRFDEKRQSCLPSSVSECFACPPTGASNVPNPAACDRYVLCFHGVPHERICPAGLLFNQQIGQCDLSHKVTCSAGN
uniref:Chitin-binding type-2 domain-containing protein n=1 Tax=Anopheles atroparvus TaxID=41427 RepID=A0A182J9A6_ANOAO